MRPRLRPVAEPRPLRLGAHYSVEASRPGHEPTPTELGCEAAAARYDVVVPFGGDGTINEAADGLAGSDVPLTCLPGGSTNVFAERAQAREPD